MKRMYWLLAVPLAAALAFVQCGGGDGGGAGKDSLKNATTTEPSGSFTSETQIEAAVEGLLNGGVSGAAGIVPKQDPHSARAVRIVEDLLKTRSQTGSECYTTDGETKMTIDLDCLGEGSGTVSLTCDPTFEAFSTCTDAYCEMKYDDVAMGDSTADGTIYIYRFGGTSCNNCLAAEGTFGGTTVTNDFIACANDTGEPTLIVVEDADGNVFIIDNIFCDPDFEMPETCTFDVTDENGTTSCAVTNASSEAYDLTCAF